METKPFEDLFGDPQLKTLRQSVAKKTFAKCLVNYVAGLRSNIDQILKMALKLYLFGMNTLRKEYSSLATAINLNLVAAIL
jgi:hypothetical protein